MSLTIRQKADAVGTFRHLSVWYMETLSRWVPTTPEMDAKVLFGRHIWELAQHADSLGKRTHELRAALHYTVPCAPQYDRPTQELAAATDSAERFMGFYEAALPDLDARYAMYLQDTDDLLDEPTVRILERARADIRRMCREATASAAECPALTTPSTSFASDLAARFAAVEGFDFIAFRPPRETNLEISS